ncbi:MAG: UPF0175 family protein [Candidatus Methanoperedens sp.]|nr:UPF0175 family protein [Candidatus Methanoperedens sp.]
MAINKAHGMFLRLNISNRNIKMIVMETISVKMNEEFSKALDELREPRIKKQTLIKNLLMSGLKQYKIELAIKKYIEGEISTWKAAEIAGISLRNMNRILQEKGIEMHYSQESLREDLE